MLCGNQSNQHALAVKAAAQVEIVGIVLETRRSKQKRDLSFYLSKAADKLLFGRIGASWRAMLAHYSAYTAQLGAFRTLHTPDINSPETLAFIQELKPDLVMVSGTSLVKEKILALQPPRGIINLHTGLSPYIKGGPNCTNWCIANHTMHLVGNTIMWIDKGIDSGNIIATETTPLTGDESLDALHLNVMEHAHDLYIRALRKIKNDAANVPSVPQSSIAKGELFLSGMWNFKAKRRFMKSVDSGASQLELKSEANKKRREELKLVPLEIL